MNEKTTLKKRLEEYFEIDKNIIPDFPKNMLIELSNICNHSCIFCANSKMTRKKTYIDEKFINRILNEAYNLGTKEVGFYLTGEPLINKNLESYIEKAKEIGYQYVYITTNGALLEENRVKGLVNAGIDSIKFSINAGTRESYKLIHGKDDFEKVLNNLIYLYEYRKNNNKQFKIFISCVLTKYTINEKEIIYNKLKEYVDDIVFMNCRNQCGVMYEINDLLIINEEDKINSTNNICPLPFKKLHITCEGYLTACCADFQNYLVVADLNNEMLGDAWKNEKFKELRRRHIEDKLEGTLCYNCVQNKNKEIKPLYENLSTEYDCKLFNKTSDIIEVCNIFEQ